MRDAGTGEPAWELYSADVTFKTRGDLGDSDVFHGHEGLGRALRGFRDVWGESISLELAGVLGSGEPLIVEPPPVWHPDGEFINSRDDPDHATHRGIEAIRTQHQGWLDAYPDLRVEPLEVRANGEKVFVWARFSGHGADSGAPMEMELAHVATTEGGRLRRVEEFFDRAEAMEAAGLAP